MNYSKNNKDKRAAIRRKYKCAVITGLLAINGWKTGNKSDESPEEFSSTAGRIADALIAEDIEHECK